MRSYYVPAAAPTDPRAAATPAGILLRLALIVVIVFAWQVHALPSSAAKRPAPPPQPGTTLANCGGTATPEQPQPVECTATFVLAINTPARLMLQPAPDFDGRLSACAWREGDSFCTLYFEAVFADGEQAGTTSGTTDPQTLTAGTWTLGVSAGDYLLSTPESPVPRLCLIPWPLDPYCSFGAGPVPFGSSFGTADGDFAGSVVAA